MGVDSQQADLRLEYVVTREEIEEARSLHLRHVMGGGSKALTWVKLVGILIVAIGLFYFQLPQAYRKYLLIGVPAVLAGAAVAMLANLLEKKKSDACPGLNAQTGAAEA